VDEKEKKWSDLNKKEKSHIKSIGGAIGIAFFIEYWKMSTPKQKFNIAFFWISLASIGAFIDDIGYEIATPLIWIILLRGVFCVSFRHSKRKKLEKGDTFLERFNNHWQKQSLSQKFWLLFGILMLLMFAIAIIYPLLQLLQS